MNRRRNQLKARPRHRSVPLTLLLIAIGSALPLLGQGAPQAGLATVASRLMPGAVLAAFNITPPSPAAEKVARPADDTASGPMTSGSPASAGIGRSPPAADLGAIAQSGTPTPPLTPARAASAEAAGSPASPAAPGLTGPAPEVAAPVRARGAPGDSPSSAQAAARPEQPAAAPDPPPARTAVAAPPPPDIPPLPAAGDRPRPTPAMVPPMKRVQPKTPPLPFSMSGKAPAKPAVKKASAKKSRKSK